jgi:hypothetical protein
MVTTNPRPLHGLVGIPTRIAISRWREKLLGHYAVVTGTPARFILRIGWAQRSPPGPGYLATPWPSQSGFWHLLILLPAWNTILARSKPRFLTHFSVFGLPRLDR